MECPKAVLFDFDDTLAPSFEPPSAEMVSRVSLLIQRMPVAIVTGRDFAWMDRDFLPRVATADHTERFYVMPEGAAQCFVWSGRAWKEMYGHSLGEKDRGHIEKVILECVRKTGVLEGLPVFGPQFVHRKAAVAFAALGWQVPRDLRHTWDPGNVRRTALRDSIARELPGFDVLMGGSTTIDVTKKGINKSCGVLWLSEHLRIQPQEMLYVGDTLFPGGNDYVVIPTGVQTRETNGPEQTLSIIGEVLAACAPSG